MTTATLSAGKWLNDGTLPTRLPWRRIAGLSIAALGTAAMLASGARTLLALLG